MCRTKVLSSSWPSVPPRRSVRAMSQAHSLGPDALMAYNGFSGLLVLCSLLVPVSGAR
jgi:hypothetical protein